ncbi:MAG TPA: hypothetical protein VMH27_23290 [Puia sp.]|nr:hypothetical protein [Puia sp.]
MIDQYEVPTLIAGQFPQIKGDLSDEAVGSSVYRSIQALTDYTKRMALEHDFSMVQKCMALVENMYEKGNLIVRNAVENIFVFSFSTLLCRCNIVEWKIVQSYMPLDLYSLYVQQVLKSKC